MIYSDMWGQTTSIHFSWTFEVFEGFGRIGRESQGGNREVGEGGREVVDGVIKLFTQREVGEGGREVINELVEGVAKGEVGEERREVGDGFIEVSDEVEVREEGRERREVNGRGEHGIDL